MTNAAYEKITQLQYRCRHAEQRVQALESGDEYRKLRLGMKRQRRYYENLLKRKDREITRLSRQVSSNREMWFQVYEDIQKEYEDRLSKAGRAIEKMEQRIREKDDKISEQKKRISEKTDEVVAERAKLNDEKEKNQKLQAQVDQNFQNSSTPSSQDAYRGKVHNNRPKTDRNEGGQPGHSGHRRKILAVTEEPVFIDAPGEIKNNPDFYEVSGPNATVHKQVIGICFGVKVTDYWAKMYRNRKTGAKYHAPFPEGVQLEVNYDDSVKALRKGDIVQIFPEGHNTKDGNVAPFKTPYLMIIMRSGKPVIPVVLDGNYGLFKRVHVIIGKPIYPDELQLSDVCSEEQIARANDYIRNRVVSLKCLLEQKCKGGGPSDS